MIFYGVGDNLEVIVNKLGELPGGAYSRLFDGSKEKIGKKRYGIEIEPPENLRDVPDGTIVAVVASNGRQQIFDTIKKINPKLICKPFWGGALPAAGFCRQCGREVPFWYLAGEENLTSHRHIIGAGLRHGTCPFCQGNDRNRWVDFVLANFTNIYQGQGLKVMHFAPEKLLHDKLERCYGQDYYTCDLRKGVGKYQVDITDIPFRNQMFDFIIVNHVLEHIPDEAKAVGELRRCLKDSGTLVLSFPIATDTDTVEDPSVTSEVERRRLFSQEDHVRLYGRDYKSRMERHGLTVKVCSPATLLQPETAAWLGFIPDDVVMLCRKA